MKTAIASAIGAAGTALLCASLLFVQPVPATAYSGCEVAGGPGGNCCACPDGACEAVQHQGVQRCGTGWCSPKECEWLN